MSSKPEPKKFFRRKVVYFLILLLLALISGVAWFLFGNPDLLGKPDLPWHPYLLTIMSVCGVLAICFLLGAAVDVGYASRFDQHTDFSKKTLWDWLGAILVPFTIGLFTLAITVQQSSLSELQHQSDQFLSMDQQNENALQGYLDQISDLLLHENLQQSKPGDLVRVVATSRTFVLLPHLDGVRRSDVVRFLYKSGLINGANPILSLKGADLAYLRLGSSDDLHGVNLKGASLAHSEFNGANLGDALFDDSDLSTSTFDGSLLDKASFKGALVSEGQLNAAQSHQGTIKPDGSTYP